jgi:dTDP-4-dehydrorhamnose 3,5-epimerase
VEQETLDNGLSYDAETLGRLGCDRLAHGMAILPLPHFPDDRGSLTELCRNSWIEGKAPVQWNCVRSKAKVMRGLHIHLHYHEYYAVVSGSLMVGFEDIREGSPTYGLTGLFTVRATDNLAVASPPGVLHGLYFPEESILLAGAGRYYNLENELGCHWKDPAVSIPWPFQDAILSERDAAHPRLEKVLPRVPGWSA